MRDILFSLDHNQTWRLGWQLTTQDGWQVNSRILDLADPDLGLDLPTGRQGGGGPSCLQRWICELLFYGYQRQRRLQGKNIHWKLWKYIRLMNNFVSFYAMLFSILCIYPQFNQVFAECGRVWLRRSWTFFFLASSPSLWYKAYFTQIPNVSYFRVLVHDLAFQYRPCVFQARITVITGWVLGKGPCGPTCNVGDVGRSTRDSRRGVIIASGDRARFGNWSKEMQPLDNSITATYEDITNHVNDMIQG